MAFQDFLDTLTQELGFEVTTFNFVMFVFFITVLMIIALIHLLRMQKRAGSRCKLADPEHKIQGNFVKSGGSFINKMGNFFKKRRSFINKPSKSAVQPNIQKNNTPDTYTNVHNEQENIMEKSESRTVSSVIAKSIRDEIDRQVNEIIIPYIDKKLGGIENSGRFFEEKQEKEFTNFQNEKTENFFADTKDINIDDDTLDIDDLPKIKTKEEIVDDELAWKPKKY